MHAQGVQWQFRFLRRNVVVLNGLESHDLLKLERTPTVRFVDRGPRQAREETILGEFDMSSNRIFAMQQAYPQADGEGLLLSIKEKPFDQQDLDLRNRVETSNGKFDEPSTLHATVMATIAGGGGNTSPDARGVAPAVMLTTSDFDVLLPDIYPTAVAQQYLVQNHSYGVGIENYYGIESNAYDQFVHNRPEVLHIFSSGNVGNQAAVDGKYAGLAGVANLTGQFKTSKNTLTVGSVDALGNLAPRSSRGPAHDGRIKPELVAYGDAGSSESAAVVSGAAITLQDLYRQKYNTTADAALIKALLINGADDVEAPHVDYKSGFGNVNLLQSARMIDQEKIVLNVYSGAEQESVVSVADGVDLLKVTIAWTDPAADPNASKALVHDLDLKLVHITSGETYLPWVLNPSPALPALGSEAVRGRDTLNNVEQITVTAPSAGLWRIVVNGGVVPASGQRYFIAWQTFSGFEWISPVPGKGLVADDVTLLLWDWYGGTANGMLEYELEGTGTWQVIDGDVPLGNRYYQWRTPATDGRIRFRMSTPQGQFISEFVTNTKPIRLQVGFNCEDALLLEWPRRGSSWQLYRLGDKYMEPMAVLTDTFTVISKTSSQSVYYAVAPVVNGVPGLREFTIDYTRQGVGCYIKSFLPRASVVSDMVVFDAQLGSVYNLDEIVFFRTDERGREVEVSRIGTPLPKDFSFTDEEPPRGALTYRIVLRKANETIAESASVPILVIDERDLYVYPNPVAEGDLVDVVLQDSGIVSAELLDSQGRSISGFVEVTGFQSVELQGLKRGLYILRIHTSRGSVLTRRLVVK